jgi:SAM-dependent methyltransferase
MSEFNFSSLDICQDIDSADEMFCENRDHYFSVGESALKNIMLALMSTGIHPRSILDLPCGHGRVLRYIAAKFPEAKITACDLNYSGVDFCSKTFGARGFYSSKDVKSLDLGDKYDLIWCGSLLTHLDQERWVDWLGFFSRHLAADGIVLFTTHGLLPFRRMFLGHTRYGLDTNSVISCLNGYRESGFGYANYYHSNDYGISISSPSWVLQEIESFPDLSLVSFRPQGWDKHQDVFVAQKRVCFDKTITFDEDFYFAHNPDVEAAVKSGLFTSGYDHYRQAGYQEGRIAAFDETFYLDYYPDVREAVQAGLFTSGYDHYRLYGRQEGRFPTI